MIRQDFPHTRLLVSDTNTGFADATNQGLRHAHGRYVLLLNSDTIVLPDAIREMVSYLDMHPHVGALGPRLLNEDRSLQSSARDFSCLWDDILGTLEVHRWPVIGTQVRRHKMRTSVDWSDHRRTREVDWVTGACLMLRREAIEQVGGLDPGYFFFFEEMDLCYRLRQCGWSTIFLATAQIVHLGGRSAARVPAARLIWHYRSMLRFYRLHHGRFQLSVLRSVVILVAAAHLVWLMLRHRHTPNAHSVLFAYARVLTLATQCRSRVSPTHSTRGDTAA
jgi:GT2 family glycosyltransferase